MKKLLIVLAIALAVLFTGCDQPATQAIPEEMTITSVAYKTITNGTTMFMEDENIIKAMCVSLFDVIVTTTKDGTAYEIEPSASISKTDLDAKMKIFSDSMADIPGMTTEYSYDFNNGLFTYIIEMSIAL